MHQKWFFRLICTLMCLFLFVGEIRLLNVEEDYEKCSDDISCRVPYTTCVRYARSSLGKCVCRENFFRVNETVLYRCYKEISEEGETCEIDIQCQRSFGVLAQCANNKCVCKANSHFDTKRCYPTFKLGSRCNYTENCIMSTGDKALCHKGYCVCPYPDEVRSDDGLFCVRRAMIGDKCLENSQCPSANSWCDGICRCSEGYSISFNRTVCMQDAQKLGDKCSEDVQCSKNIENGECKSGLCQCSTEYHHGKDNRCYKNAAMDDFCYETEECVVHEALRHLVECQNGTCKCTSKDKEDCSSLATINYMVSLIVNTMFFLGVLLLK